jgi:hypothetical protein
LIRGGVRRKKKSSPKKSDRNFSEEQQQDSLEKQQEGLRTEENSTSTNVNCGQIWQNGVSDLRIALNTDRFAVWEEMPGPQHIAAVTELRLAFYAWKEDKDADMEYTSTDCNILLNDSYAIPPRSEHSKSTPVIVI